MQKIDQQWYDRARALGRVNFIEHYAGDKALRDRLKASFFASTSHDMVLQYPGLEGIDFSYLTNQYLSFKESVQQESNQFIRLAYTDWCDEQVLLLQLLQSTAEDDKETFQRVTELLYGKPHEEVFRQVVATIYGFFEEALQQKSVITKRSAENVLTILSSVDRNISPLFTNIYAPKGEVLNDSEYIVHRFEEALKERGIKDWEIVLSHDTSSSFIYVNQDDKQVIVPASRQASDWYIEALIRHEIGVHVMRRVNAERQPFGLLEMGLAGYIKGDEGVAKIEEAKVTYQMFHASLELYLGIGLVYGFAGKKCTIQDIYQFFYDYYIAIHHQLKVNPEKAASHAWARAVKIFRGTKGNDLGICLTKDLVYLQGYLDITKTLKQYPTEEKRILTGKYDPSNDHHRAILDGVGV